MPHEPQDGKVLMGLEHQKFHQEEQVTYEVHVRFV